MLYSVFIIARMFANRNKKEQKCKRIRKRKVCQFKMGNKPFIATYSSVKKTHVYI